MSEIELEPRLPYMRREAREGVVAMSEKRYLLTEPEAREYARLLGMRDAGAGAARLLESHEHRERTCRLIPNEGHHGTDGLGWNCSECDYEFDEYQHQTAVFCQNCGAKVVE